MPEGLEAEIWRRAAMPLIGRTIECIRVDERVAPPEIECRLVGARIVGVSRIGKVVLFDLADAVETETLGLHFGMTGRLIIDGVAPIERLEYASAADRPKWDRLRIWTETSVDGASEPVALRLNDPRRLGRVSLDPDFSAMGPDALTLRRNELAGRLRGRRLAVKSALLDQTIVAGLGNLCADEVLLWAGVAPARPVDELTGADVTALAQACREQLPAMLRRGGSTAGRLDPERRAAPGRCPFDGAPLVRSTIGGRTAVWCPQHQR